MTLTVFWQKAVLSVAVLNVVLGAKAARPSGLLVPLKHVQSNVFEVGDGPGPYEITNAQMVKQKQDESNSGGGFMDFLTGPTEYLASMLMSGFLGSSSDEEPPVPPPPPPGPPRKRFPGPRSKRIPGRPPGPPFAHGGRFRGRHPNHPAFYPPRHFVDSRKDGKDGHWTGGFSSHFKLIEKETADKVIVHVGGNSDNDNALGKKESHEKTVNDINPRQTVQNVGHKTEKAAAFQQTPTSDKSFSVRLPLQTIDTRGASDTLPRLETFGLPDASGNSNSQFTHSVDTSSAGQPAHHNSFPQHFISRPRDNTAANDQDIVQKWEQWGALVGKRPTLNSITKLNQVNVGFEETVPSAPTTLQTIYNSMVTLHNSLTGTVPAKPDKVKPQNTQPILDKPNGFFQGSYSIVSPYDDVNNINDVIRQNFLGNSATAQYIPSASAAHQNIFSYTPSNNNNNNRFINTQQIKTPDIKSFQQSGFVFPSSSRYHQNANSRVQDSKSQEDQNERSERGKLHSVADVVDALKIVADALENTAEGEKIYLTKFAQDILVKNEHRRSDTDRSDSEISSYTSYHVEPVSFIDLTAINGNGDHLTKSSYSQLR